MAKILIIDDAKFMRTMFKTIINMIGGHETIEAINGREGIEKIYSEGPDIVITDILMPEMDGLELLKELQDANMSTRIIVVSSNTESSTREQCIDLGASAFLSKPPSIEKLEMTIKEVLSRGKQDE